MGIYIPPGYSTGLIKRDYKSHPSGYLSFAPSFRDSMLVPESEWPERLKEQKAKKASLLDLRKKFFAYLKSLDQDGLGLCWAFSSTKAVMYLRAIMNEPGIRLSAWWVAGKVVNWQDQGYWGSASLAQIAKGGVPSEEKCPSYKSSYDTADVAADAATRKVTKWMDGSEDRGKNRAMMISCFLLGLPPVLDFNHMGHSMCGCNLESIDPLEINCDNSWGGSGGPDGLYNLKGSDAIPDGIVCPEITLAV